MDMARAVGLSEADINAAVVAAVEGNPRRVRALEDFANEEQAKK